jgi:hypothetical protein
MIIAKIPDMNICIQLTRKLLSTKVGGTSLSKIFEIFNTWLYFLHVLTYSMKSKDFLSQRKRQSTLNQENRLKLNCSFERSFKTVKHLRIYTKNLYFFQESTYVLRWTCMGIQFSVGMI